MKINIPKKLEIFGHLYEIIDRDEEKTGADSFGSHFGRINKIFLNTLVKGSQRESSFFHELIEAVNWHLQLKLSHDQIVGLETGLYSILKKL